MQPVIVISLNKVNSYLVVGVVRECHPVGAYFSYGALVYQLGVLVRF